MLENVYGRTSGSEAKLIAWLFEQAKKKNPAQTLRLEDCYQVLLDQPMVGKSSDFIVVIGEDVFIVYSCPACETAAVHPKHWLRCVRVDSLNKPGGTAVHGSWYCPATGCLTKWTWKAGGEKRVLLIPDTDHVGKLKRVFIGKTTPREEHTITLLKTANLLLKVWDRGRQKHIILGKKALCKAISKLDEEF